MGWTVDTRRRRDRLRHRPHLEGLDDRCLLSAGIEGPWAQVGTMVRVQHPGSMTAGHAEALKGKGIRHVGRHQGHHRAGLEQPAGTLTSAGPATAYDSIIGAAQARSTYGVDGTGMTVAVIDTGVDYKNPDLGGGFGPGAKVIAGYDFSTSTPDPMATTSQHGTAVAGLIGSTGGQDGGVAPGVKIVGLKVTDGTNTASLDSMARALQWVINNHAQYNISVVNISLSDGANYAHNWFATGGGVAEQVTQLIGQLRGMNIPVVVAAGNSFNASAPQQGEGFAAIVAGTISVTATDLHGHLLPDAQRLGASVGGASATVIAAPGDQLLSPSGGAGTSTVEGTSFATPLVSGAIVLLQQIYEQRFGTLPTVDQLQSWLQNGSDPIHDPVTGITIGQLDIPQAAALIPNASQSPATKPRPSYIQVSTTSVAPAPASTPAAQTTSVATTSTPTRTPTPAPTPPAPPSPPSPSPAPAAPVPQQVFTAVAAGSSSSQTAPGLGWFLQNVRVWAASSAARG
jgi:type VI secretion system secreted protein VgrG